MTAATFAVTFDPTAFHIDATDADRDGLPDAVSLAVGANQTAVVDVDADQGRVEIALFATTTDAPLLTTGTLVTLTLAANADKAGAYPVTLVDGSLGNDSGQSLAVTLVDGSLQISDETTVEEIYLPLISN